VSRINPQREGIEMSKFLKVTAALLLLFSSACQKVSGGISRYPPDLPPYGSPKWLGGRTVPVCGVAIKQFLYVVRTGEKWEADYLENAKHPFRLYHETYDIQFQYAPKTEIWLDFDSDGVPEEYIGEESHRILDQCEIIRHLKMQ